MEITTPAILFPAISLLFLSYTNKFLAFASLIRQLKQSNEKGNSRKVLDQMKNLRKRLILAKYMQLSGIISFIFCSGSMLLLYLEFNILGVYLFGTSMIFLTLSLLFCLWEIIISTDAINVELDSIKY